MLTLEELINIINQHFDILDKSKLRNIFLDNSYSEDDLIEKIMDYFDTKDEIEIIIEQYINSKIKESRILSVEESIKEKDKSLKQLKNRLKTKEKKDGK